MIDENGDLIKADPLRYEKRSRILARVAEIYDQAGGKFLLLVSNCNAEFLDSSIILEGLSPEQAQSMSCESMRKMCELANKSDCHEA